MFFPELCHKLALYPEIKNIFVKIQQHLSGKLLHNPMENWLNFDK